MADIELLMYSQALEPFSGRAISAVLAQLSMTRRGEYESKIPELAELVHLVKLEDRPKLGPWVPCGECNSGMRIEDRNGQTFAVRCDCWVRWKQGAGRSRAD